MNIHITNKIGKPAKKHLETFKTRFPAFKFTRDIVYNGISIEIDDDDKDDFFEALASAGYDYESDEEDVGDGSNVPKMPKSKPKLAKANPKLPKVRPLIPKH